MKKNKYIAEVFGDDAVLKKLPINYPLGKVFLKDEKEIITKVVYSEIHQTQSYPVSSFYKPISKIV